MCRSGIWRVFVEVVTLPAWGMLVIDTGRVKSGRVVRDSSMVESLGTALRPDFTDTPIHTVWGSVIRLVRLIVFLVLFCGCGRPILGCGAVRNGTFDTALPPPITRYYALYRCHCPPSMTQLFGRILPQIIFHYSSS